MTNDAIVEPEAKPPANSARGQVWRVIVLAMIAGYVDSYVFVNYQVFASFMSGNTTQAGMLAGQMELAEAAHSFLPIPLFVVGILVGALLGHSSPRHLLSWLFGLIATLLAV